MKEEPQKPPRECHYCREWIDEFDLYRVDFLGRAMCTGCYEWIHEDLSDKQDD